MHYLSTNQPRPLHALVTELWRFDRRSTVGLVALNLTGALLEGMGLMLLVPLLHLAGVFGGATSPFPLPLPNSLTTWLGGLAADQRLILLLCVFVGLIILQSAVNLRREMLSVHLRLSFS